jgi:hypothetical protein
MADPLREQALMRKLQDLPREKVAEVEDFVDYLRRNPDASHTNFEARLSEAVLRRIWDNPEDAEYDRL